MFEGRLNTILSKREPWEETTASAFRKAPQPGREGKTFFSGLMPLGVKGMRDCRAKGSPTLLIREEGCGSLSWGHSACCPLKAGCVLTRPEDGWHDLKFQRPRILGKGHMWKWLPGKALFPSESLSKG